MKKCECFRSPKFFPGWRRREEEYKKAPPSSGCKELFSHKLLKHKVFPLDNKNTFLETPHTANIFVTSRTALFEIYHSFIISHLYTSHTPHTHTPPSNQCPGESCSIVSGSVPIRIPVSTMSDPQRQPSRRPGIGFGERPRLTVEEMFLLENPEPEDPTSSSGAPTPGPSGPPSKPDWFKPVVPVTQAIARISNDTSLSAKVKDDRLRATHKASSGLLDHLLF